VNYFAREVQGMSKPIRSQCEGPLRGKVHLFLTGILVGSVLGSCAFFDLLEPITPGTSSNYNLYVGDQAFKKVFIVDAQTNAIVDTIGGFRYEVYDVAVAKDGGILFVCTRSGTINAPGEIYSVFLSHRSKSLLYSGLGSVFVSAQGDAFLVSNGRIGKIDPGGTTVSFFDSLDIIDDGGYNYQSVAFDANKPLLYVVTNESRLVAYDYHARSVVRNYQGLYNVVHIITSKDGNTIYATMAPARCVAFDLQRDSIMRSAAANLAGSLALSANEGQLFVTDPGGYLIPEPAPSGTVSVFDPTTLDLIGDLDVKKIAPYGVSWQTDQIIILPDNEKAFVGNATTAVYVVDTRQLQVRSLIQFPWPRFIRALTLAKKPQQ
jgi:hypothetical protein